MTPATVTAASRSHVLPEQPNVDIRWLFGQPRGNRPIRIQCPNPEHYDSDPSCDVYPDGVWCHSCHWKENAREVLARLGHSGEGLPAAPPRDKSKGSGFTRRVDDLSVPDATRVTVRVAHAFLTRGPRRERLEWLVERGIFRRAVDQQLIGHDSERFVIPVWTTLGELAGVRYRSDPLYCDPEAPKYVNPPHQPTLLYRPNPGGNPVVITEGELDALLLSQYGIDAVTTTNGAQSLSTLLGPRMFNGPVYLAVDRDDEGDRAAQMLEAKFKRPLPRLDWGEAKDPTDALRVIYPHERRKEVERWIACAQPN